jgi:uncharacterized surface anchored protein
MRACRRCLAFGTLLRIVLMVFMLSSVAAVQPGIGAAQDAEPTATEVATETAAPAETLTPEVTSTQTLPAETPAAEPSTSTPVPTPSATEEPTLAPTVSATTEGSQPESTTVPTSTPTASGAVASDADLTATLLIHKRDASNQPLPGACFQIFTNNNGVPGYGSTNFCDWYTGPNDGEIAISGVSGGSFFLRESRPPEGYLAAADQLITLTAGQTLDVTIVDQLGGAIELHAVDDHGHPIHDICPTVYLDAGGGTPGELLTEGSCLPGSSLFDGVSKLVGLPAGTYVLVQTEALKGYQPSAPIPFTIALGETKTIQIVNTLISKVLVTSVDSTSPTTKLPGACFYVYVDAGGGSRGNFVELACDGNDGLNDGVTTLLGLVGSYVLTQPDAPALFKAAADQPFTIGLGETKSLTVSNEPYGTVRVHKKKPSGAALPGSCFVAIWKSGSENAGNWGGSPVCDESDGANDGTIDLRLPNGSFTIQEYSAPAGYVRAPNTTAELDGPGMVELTITDPIPSTLTLKYVDVWHDPLPQGCITITGTNDDFGDLSPVSACDYYGGTIDGQVIFKNLTWGMWKTSADPAHHFPETIVTLNPGESKTIEIMLSQDPPKITRGPVVSGVTQTAATIYWETDQKTIGSVKYGLTTGLGRTAPSTPEQPTKTHRITLTDLKASTLFYLQVQSTSPNGSISSKTYSFRTPGSTATGKVVVTKVKSDGTSLPGACFDVYRNAGGGELGTYIRGTCDWFEKDGNNGKITITGLSAGHYVLVEFYAPARYRLAKHVLFDLAAGQTKQLKVTDYGGGTTVRVTSRIKGRSTLIKGSCFSIYKQQSDGTIGAYLTNMCDGFDGEDGVTTFSGLPRGEYFLWEDYGPPGYVRDPIMQFVVSNTSYGEDITFYYRLLTDTGNVVLKAIDSNDQLVPGACFALYRASSSGALNSFVKDACDWSDGYNDGKTYFGGVTAGLYIAVEYIAPKGFIAGKKTAFTKVSGQQTSKRIRQVPGGVEVRVTTLKGSTTSKAAGACYGLFRYANGQWQFVTEACDDWDGANDGVTRIRGVATGTYRLYQIVTPNGYSRPAYVTITVGTTTKSVTVRMYPR